MNSFFKSVFTITKITVSAGIMLALSYSFTKYKIAYQERQEILNAFKSILPYHNNEPDKDYEIINNQKVFVAKDNGTITGYAVNIINTQGYGGAISILTGTDSKGAVYGIAIIYHSETPGLGDKITNKSFLDLFQGFTVNDKIAVKKDGGTIEQFSGATISPRAVAAGVKDSLTVINGMIGK